MKMSLQKLKRLINEAIKQIYDLNREISFEEAERLIDILEKEKTGHFEPQNESDQELVVILDRQKEIEKIPKINKITPRNYFVYFENTKFSYEETELIKRKYCIRTILNRMRNLTSHAALKGIIDLFTRYSNGESEDTILQEYEENVDLHIQTIHNLLQNSIEYDEYEEYNEEAMNAAEIITSSIRDGLDIIHCETADCAVDIATGGYEISELAIIFTDLAKTMKFMKDWNQN